MGLGRGGMPSTWVPNIGKELAMPTWLQSQFRAQIKNQTPPKNVPLCMIPSHLQCGWECWSWSFRMIVWGTFQKRAAKTSGAPNPGILGEKQMRAIADSSTSHDLSQFYGVGGGEDKKLQILWKRFPSSIPESAAELACFKAASWPQLPQWHFS